MKKISILALCLMAGATLFAQTQVTADKTGTELQAAIDAAEAGTTVYVQAGTFNGNFKMKEGVNVSGGWNEDFTAQTDYATILDAQSDGRVLEQPANFTTLTVWSNLTIQNGKLTAASSVPANNLGSGVALGKKGQVKHCLIQNNTYDYNGNCMGGGVGNDAVDANTDVCVDDCWIRNNKASHGGGVRVRGTVQNSIIENNLTEANAAGGVHLQGGRLVGCIVRGNTGKATGGVRAFGKCDVINNLIYNNTAKEAVGGLGLESALSNVIGNTIVCNNQLTGTGAQAGVKVTNNLNANGTFFVNNVVWGNMSNGVAEAQNVYYISRYDKTQGQRSNNAIIGQLSDDSAETSVKLTADNPGFADPEHGDFSLLFTSVLIDRGNSAKTTVTEDLAGNKRIQGPAVDLGCYELPYYQLTIADFEHATLTVGTDPLVAGEYALPQGYTTAATIVADEGYSIKSVKLGDATLEPAEGVYTLPALTADVTLTITVEQIVVNLTIAAFEHATLTVEGVGVTVAGTYPVPYGYTTTATIAVEEGYKIKSVKLGDAVLEPVDGVYTIPALTADVTVTIEVEQIILNLTVAAFEHATLTVEGIGVLAAGTYPVPYGFTTTATIAVEEGYKLVSVKLGEEELVPVDGVYTIPAIQADATITILVEKDEATGLDDVTSNVCKKVIRDGQVMIIRGDKTINILGF